MDEIKSKEAVHILQLFVKAFNGGAFGGAALIVAYEAARQFLEDNFPEKEPKP